MPIPERPVPDLNRYSRHYYDVHQIWTHPDYGVATASLRELAEACRQHKELMFRAPDHRYDRAVPGSYRLVPTEDMRAKLAADYKRMSAMIFGTPPAFDDVMASIEALEHVSQHRAGFQRNALNRFLSLGLKSAAWGIGIE
jgi:hypothetical protein